jgi:hypothetical protein
MTNQSHQTFHVHGFTESESCDEAFQPNILSSWVHFGGLMTTQSNGTPENLDSEEKSRKWLQLVVDMWKCRLAILGNTSSLTVLKSMLARLRDSCYFNDTANIQADVSVARKMVRILIFQIGTLFPYDRLNLPTSTLFAELKYDHKSFPSSVTTKVHVQSLFEILQ